MSAEPCDSCGMVLPGVIESMDTDEGIQRCDECELYPGDCEAAQALASLVGGVVCYQAEETGERVRWSGTHLGPMIEDQSNPWVEVEGVPVSWSEWLRLPHVVVFEYNTEADGSEVQEGQREPMTIHGPFTNRLQAWLWMNAQPDDTDVREAYVAALNDPAERVVKPALT
jgi:hypothetical protein